MKRNQLIFITSGLLLLGCTQNKVDLPATPPKPAAATPASQGATPAPQGATPAPQGATPAPQTAPIGDAQAATAPVPAATEFVYCWRRAAGPSPW